VVVRALSAGGRHTSVVLVYVGMALLVGAWLVLGRALRRHAR